MFAVKTMKEKMKNKLTTILPLLMLGALVGGCGPTHEETCRAFTVDYSAPYDSTSLVPMGKALMPITTHNPARWRGRASCPSGNFEYATGTQMAVDDEIIITVPGKATPHNNAHGGGR